MLYLANIVGHHSVTSQLHSNVPRAFLASVLVPVGTSARLAVGLLWRPILQIRFHQKLARQTDSKTSLQAIS